jgi:hypothetical protein
MMPKAQLIPTLFLLLFSLPLLSQTPMNNVQMGKILKDVGDKLEGGLGNWQVYYKERVLFVITDETNNRMRIFTPIADVENVKEAAFSAMLKANFHAALDAKYALFDDFVVSLFTHPLKELTPHQFKDALLQVALAADNFGTTYSSTDLIFTPGIEDKEATPQKDKKINQKPKKKTR